MSETPLISLIIPVYNSANYLPNCLNSIISQTLTNFEAIIVNDGSTDNSLEIINAYAKNNPQFKVINKTNGGQGVSRNLALQTALGKYIMFVDSDDLLANINSLQIAVDAISSNNSDVTIFSYQKLYSTALIPKVKHFNFLKNTTINSIEDKKTFLLNKGIGAPWNKIYNKDFLIKHNIKFAEHLKFEDAVFFWLAICHAGSIGFCNNILYTYRKHSLSSMRSNYQLNLDIITIYQLITNHLKEYNLFNNYEDILILRALPSIKSQFKKTPFKYKRQFFNHASKFITTLNLNRIDASNKKYQNIKKLNTTCFIGFLIKSYL